MKKIIFIYSLLFIVILSGLVLYWSFFRSASESLVDGRENRDLNTGKVLSLPELETEQKIFDQAITNQDKDFCARLTSATSRDICLKEIALSANNESTCSLIVSAEEQLDCVDSLKIKTALQNGALPDCSNIKSAESADFCVREVAQTKSQEDCLQLESEKLVNTCLAVVIYKSAKEAGRADLCREIPDRMMIANCLSEIMGVDNLSDADGDGLRFFEEILNDTDPNNANSDGDSYSDADEVAAGHSPIGNGLAWYYYLSCHEIEETILREACFLESDEGRISYQVCSQLKNKYLRDYCFKKSEY
jgi:hypothetical protein